jgi:hypothetical protein
MDSFSTEAMKLGAQGKIFQVTEIKTLPQYLLPFLKHIL